MMSQDTRAEIYSRSLEIASRLITASNRDQQYDIFQHLNTNQKPLPPPHLLPLEATKAMAMMIYEDITAFSQQDPAPG